MAGAPGYSGPLGMGAHVRYVRSMTVRRMESADAAARLEPHGKRIERYLLHMLRNSADAEDLAQETFLRAIRALPEFRGEAELSTWLYRIATHVCIDFLRRRETRNVVSLEEQPEADFEALTAPDAAPDARMLTPEVLFEASEMGECVRSYIDSLPESYRAAIVLHDVEGLRNREIAEVMDWSLDKAKITLHRARRRLREYLEQDCSFYRDARDVLRCERKEPGDGSAGTRTSRRSSSIR